MDPDVDPDHAYFRPRKIFFLVFLLVGYVWKLHLHHFSKIKSQKEVTKKVGINVFLSIFD